MGEPVMTKLGQLKDARRVRVSGAILPAMVVIAVAWYLMSRWRYYELDDAMIYLRYIRNFQQGHGLVYNPGEKFNGLTSPLFTYLMLAGSQLTGNLQLLNILVSGVLMTAAALVAGRLLTVTPIGSFLTALAVVSFGYFYTTFGMESALFMLLIAASLLLYKRGSDWFLVSLALLVCTRSEGVFLALPMGLDYFWRYRRLPALHVMVLAVAIGLAPMLVNWLYYGSPLPATGDAKIGQGRSGFWGKGWIFFNTRFLLDLAFSGKLAVAAGLLIAALWGAWVSRHQRITPIVLVFAMLLLAFYGGLGIPNYHWYYAPFFFVAIIFAGRAVEHLVLTIWSMPLLLPRLVLLIGLAGMVGQGWSHTVKLRGNAGHGAYTAIGEWIKANTPADTTVASVEIGHIGWYSERHIIDILGLTNAFNADFIGQGDALSWLTRYQPDYILRHEPRWDLELATDLMESKGYYLPTPGVNFNGYVLLKKSQNHTDAEIVRAVQNTRNARLR
jgi:arabinofuranosyltransferase